MQPARATPSTNGPQEGAQRFLLQQHLRPLSNLPASQPRSPASTERHESQHSLQDLVVLDGLLQVLQVGVDAADGSHVGLQQLDVAFLGEKEHGGAAAGRPAALRVFAGLTGGTADLPALPADACALLRSSPAQQSWSAAAAPPISNA